jgi:hypothetical protein
MQRTPLTAGIHTIIAIKVRNLRFFCSLMVQCLKIFFNIPGFTMNRFLGSCLFFRNGLECSRRWKWHDLCV